MSVLRPALQALLDANKLGTLATRGSDGLPRQSVVYYANRDDRIYISTLRERLKAKDVEREGWASLSVRGEEPPYPSATFSGEAVVRDEGIGEPTALVMQRISGAAKPSAAQSDEALAEAGRVLVEIAIDRVAAVTHV